MKTKHGPVRRSALEIIDEALHLVRLAPASTLAAYYVGAVPFVVGLLFFWADMSRGAFAYQRCFGAAFGMTVLFVWLKVWQTVYARRLVEQLAGAMPSRWGPSRLLGVALVQLPVQGLGLLLRPLSLLAVPMIAPTYAFYQNMTALGDGASVRGGSLARRAWRHAFEDPRQNWGVAWLLSPWLLALAVLLAVGSFRVSPVLTVFTVPVALALSPFGWALAFNIALTLRAIPWMLHYLLGTQTIFTLSGRYAVLNTTFLTAVCGLTYLCLDPLAKAAYTLRCFYADARKDGKDLIVELTHAEHMKRAGTLLMLLVCLAAVPCAAAAGRETGATAPALTSEELDDAIADVIRRPEYSWRLPRERLPDDENAKEGVLAAFFRKLGDWLKPAFDWLGLQIGRFFRWLWGLLTPRAEVPPHGASHDWRRSVQAGLFLLLAVTASVLAVFIFRVFAARRHARATPQEAAALPEIPDILDEEVTPDALPWDGWLKLAAELADRGELRAAVRAMYLACLAYLAHTERIVLARHKSNREYLRELTRHARNQPALLEAFAQNVRTFDRVWYGMHAVSQQMLESFRHNNDRILQRAQQA